MKNGFLCLALLAFALSAGAAAAQPHEQIALTEKQVLAFISAQKDMGTIEAKIGEADTRNPPTALLEELDKTARDHGFANAEEYNDVASNVSLIMAGIDPKSRKFSTQNAAAAFKAEIAAVRRDRDISNREKREIVEQLQLAMAAVKSIKYPANIDLVIKHYDAIDSALR